MVGAVTLGAVVLLVGARLVGRRGWSWWYARGEKKKLAPVIDLHTARQSLQRLQADRPVAVQDFRERRRGERHLR